MILARVRSHAGVRLSPHLVVPGGLVVLAALVGVALPLAGVRPTALAVVAVVPLLVVAALTGRHPALPVHVALVLGLTALPAQVSQAIPLGPIGVLPFEPFLYAGLLVLLLRPGRSGLPRALWAFLAVLVAGAVGGLLAGNAVRHVVDEVRPTLGFVVGAAIAVLLVRAGRVRGLLVATGVSLWISLPMTLLASSGLVRLGGREESAITGDTSVAAGQATRLLTSATALAFAAVLVAVTLTLAGRTTWRRCLPWLVPAVPIVVLSFSRSQLVALVVAALFTLGVTRRWSPLVAAGRSVVLGAAGLALVGAALLATPAGPWLSVQGEGFWTRTVGGFAGGVDTRDEGVLYRERETRAALGSVRESPVVGHGLGASYQPPQGPAGTFFGDEAPYFVHDYYLWLAVKTGLVGLAVFLVLLLVPLVRAVRIGPGLSDGALAAASLSVGWAAVNIFGPQPLGLTSAMLAGGIVGATWAYCPRGGVPATRS